MRDSIANNNKTFITEDFLLQSKFARKLYHGYASKLPIIDYHNHLSPSDIAENRAFENATRVWLDGDHYKWRAMRTFGVDEYYITGEATDKEKFQQWSQTVPYTVRNPLYHWTHLELQRYFDIPYLLTSQSSDYIYDHISETLKNESHYTVGLLDQMNTEVVCTTDDPTDTLKDHIKFGLKETSFKLLPTFRPDRIFQTDNPKLFIDYVNQLAEVSISTIHNYTDLIEAYRKRISYFHNSGCKLADHGLEKIYFFNIGAYDIESIFQKLKGHQDITEKEKQYFIFETLMHLCKEYHKKGWVQQFHLGALRNTNEKMLKTIGPDSGFDSIGDFPQAVSLSKFLNLLDTKDQLAKTIIYNLNPSYNEIFATMIGNFNTGSIKGKIQHGTAWWFLDQKDGIKKQLNALSHLSLLSCFIGMVTDSRSFLSFSRHEYFRRILCNLIAKDVKNGELPKDEKWLGKIITDVCYYNAKRYFEF